MQWIDRLGKTGSDGVGNEDLRSKPGEDETFVKRGATQLDIQELEQQPASKEAEEKTWNVTSDPK